MVCHKCGETAMGICRFCGRAVCADHFSNKLPILLAVYVGEAETPKTIVVTNVLWCGICKPQPEPIPMPELY